MPRRRDENPLGVFETDHDLEQAKAFVRLRQAALPVPESFFAVRAGALFLQVVGAAMLLLALLGAAIFTTTDVIERALDVPGLYVGVLVLVVGGGFALMVLVVGELLTLQVVIARNTRLTTVILSEMNFAEASAREEMSRLHAARAGAVPERTTPERDREVPPAVSAPLGTDLRSGNASSVLPPDPPTPRSDLTN